MRKTLALLLCICLVGCFSVNVFAQSLSDDGNAQTAVISTVVPDAHTITITVDGAKVIFGQKSVTSIKAERLSTPKIQIVADKGKVVKQVLLNGKDITDKISNGYYTFDAIYEDQTLKITTKDAPVTTENKKTNTTGTSAKSPKTGDSTNPALWLIILAISGSVAAGAVILKRKKNYTA